MKKEILENNSMSRKKFLTLSAGSALALTLLHREAKARIVCKHPICIDHDKCTGCEKCVDACPIYGEAIVMEKGKAIPWNAEECVQCDSYVEECEVGAITITEDKRFRWWKDRVEEITRELKNGNKN